MAGMKASITGLDPRFPIFVSAMQQLKRMGSPEPRGAVRPRRATVIVGFSTSGEHAVPPGQNGWLKAEGDGGRAPRMAVATDQEKDFALPGIGFRTQRTRPQRRSYSV
jgi:hypothetical protein